MIINKDIAREWYWEDAGIYNMPTCPTCKEVTYSQQRCPFCNQLLKDPEEKHIKVLKVNESIINTNKEIYGDNICTTYFMEESAELNKELAKALRGQRNLENMKKEISDVYYTLSMLMQDINMTEEELNEIISNTQETARKKMNRHINNKSKESKYI